MYIKRSCAVVVAILLFFITNKEALHATWTSPQTVSALQGNSQCVAVDPIEGTATIVWIATNSGTGRAELWSSTLAPGSVVWTPTVSVSQGISQWDVEAGLVGVDGSGNAIAAFETYQEAVFASTRPKGGDWSAPIVVSGIQPVTNSLSFQSPSLSVALNGNAILSWVAVINFPSLSFNIQASAFNAETGIWTMPTTLDNNDNETRVATDAIGNGVGIFAGSFPDTLLGRLYTVATNTWGSLTPISNVGGSISYASDVAMNDSGMAVAAWIQKFGSGTNIIYAAVLNAGSWGAPQQIGTVDDAIVSDSSVNIAINNSGIAVAAWLDKISSSLLSAYYGNIYSGGVWSTPQIISDPSVDINNPGESDRDGFSLAAHKMIDRFDFLYQGGTDGKAIRVRTLLNGIWQPIVTLGTGIIVSVEDSGYLVYDIAATNSNRNTVAVWNSGLDEESGGFMMAAEDFNPEAPPPPPLGPAPARHFHGVVEERRCYKNRNKIAHRLHFESSPDPSVTGYLLYQNGRYIETIYTPGPNEFTLYCRKRKKTYHYELRAINALGLKSHPVKVTLEGCPK